MAEVIVEMPEVLANDDVLRAAIARGARLGMQDELEVLVGEIKQDPRLPVNRGVLRRALEALPPVERGNELVAAIVAAGEASAYADVMDLGRRAGQPMSWRFLYYAPGQIGARDAWRGGWVNRKLRDWVTEIAEGLRAASAPKRRSGTRVPREAFERRACYLLSVSIASRIRSSGIAGRRFIDARRQEIGERVAASCAREIAAELARLGVGG